MYYLRKPAFCICENKDADQLRSNCAAIQRLCFRSRIVQSLYYLNPKFQASSYILWLHSLVCVGNPEDRFSHDEAHCILISGLKHRYSGYLLYRFIFCVSLMHRNVSMIANRLIKVKVSGELLFRHYNNKHIMKACQKHSLGIHWLNKMYYSLLECYNFLLLYCLC